MSQATDDTDDISIVCQALARQMLSPALAALGEGSGFVLVLVRGNQVALSSNGEEDQIVRTLQEALVRVIAGPGPVVMPDGGEAS